jgi:hypothetical protein
MSYKYENMPEEDRNALIPAITRTTPRSENCDDTNQPSMPKKFYECGICDCLHPWDWNGDCRDDANRFASYSGALPDPRVPEVPKDAEILSWEDRQKADLE